MIFHVGGFFHTVAGENEPFVAEITEILSVGGRLVKARLFGSSQFFSDLSICFCIYIRLIIVMPPLPSGRAVSPVSVKGCLTIIGEYGVSFISVESRARAVSLTSAKFVCFRIVFLLSAEIKKAHGLD